MVLINYVFLFYLEVGLSILEIYIKDNTLPSALLIKSGKILIIALLVKILKNHILYISYNS